MSDPITRAAFVTAGAAAALVPFAARAADPTRITVNYFPGASTLPLFYGLERGLFARAGLNVIAEATASSADQFGRLDRGDADIAQTTIDNPIAYDIGRGAPAVVARDFVAWFGIDDAGLHLIAAPGIATIADLRGKTVAVDSLTTGYAYALRGMLASAGLGPNDVTFVAKGATILRYKGLTDGAFDATLLTPPFNAQANERGFRTLARAIDVVGPYQGLVGIARRSWLAAHRDTAIAYLGAYRAALAAAAGDRPGGIATLMSRDATLTPAAAALTYDAMFAPGAGFQRTSAIDLAGVRTVLRLRATYDPPGAGTDPAPYIDTSFVQAAR